MPHEIHFDRPPIGFSVSAAREGTQVRVHSNGLVSSENGLQLVQYLAGPPEEVLTQIHGRRPFSRTSFDSLFVVIKRDGSGVAYLDELNVKAEIQAGRDVEAGEPVTKDDILDIISCSLGVEVPDDCGFFYVFSVHWHRAFLFDFGPLAPEPMPRWGDVNELVRQARAYLTFRERFAISETCWKALFSAGWFPFAALRSRTAQRMVDHAREGWDFDEVVPMVVDDVKSRLPHMLKAWSTHPAFASHLTLIETACNRFNADDYISTAALVYPRIEGVMRSAAIAKDGARPRVRHQLLPTVAVEDAVGRAYSLALPDKFKEYLEDVYFASFDRTSADHDTISRHTVGHGVAAAAKMNAQAAAIGLCVLHQLSVTLRRTTDAEDSLPQNTTTRSS